MTSLRDERAKRVALCGVFAAIGMALSYLEFLLPIPIPLPGVKPGLANAAVLLCFFLLSPTDALAVSALRVLLSGMLFGNLTSLFFSAAGGLLAYLSLFFGAKLKEKVSFIGLSVLMAAAHNIGQTLAAAVLFGFGVVRSYLPVLLLAGAVFGAVNGAVVNLLFPILRQKINRGQTK